MSEISGIRPDIRPDIQYPAPTGYPAENPVSGFENGRISGKTSIRSIPMQNLCADADCVGGSRVKLQKCRRLRTNRSNFRLVCWLGRFSKTKCLRKMTFFPLTLLEITRERRLLFLFRHNFFFNIKYHFNFHLHLKNCDTFSLQSALFDVSRRRGEVSDILFSYLLIFVQWKLVHI